MTQTREAVSACEANAAKRSAVVSVPDRPGVASASGLSLGQLPHHAPLAARRATSILMRRTAARILLPSPLLE
jgi:hypothetical protein